MSTVAKPIITSPADSRLYRYGALSNNLRYLLISDPEADKSAASLDVSAGSLEDPQTRPGLAHFCEHMLFMGTEKYPKENEFFQFLQKNAGSHNAYTDLTNTNYFFDSSNESFSAVLDRFAYFFKKPLFSESCTEREMKAVDSEHKKNLQSDGWRNMQLFRSQANVDSPLCRFATGDLNTLNFPSTRDDLIEFHGKFYSSNLMRVVLYSDQPLDKLEEEVKIHFQDIPDKGLPEPDYSKSPSAYNEKNLGFLFKVVPVMDKDELEFKWVIPRCFNKDLDTKPDHYLTHLLGHQGPNSLLSKLQREGYAMELYTYSNHTMGAFTVMNCGIRLTAEGLQQYERVIELVYSYLDNLRKEGPREWIFAEQKKIDELNFRFKTKENYISYVKGLAKHMSLLKPEEMEKLLISRYVTQNFDPETISFILDHMRPSQGNIYLYSKKNEPEATEQEKWYGTKYSKTQFSPELLQKMQNPEKCPDLDLPPQNKFIPESIEVKTDVDESIKVPQILRVGTNGESESWLLRDYQFKMPRASIGLKIYTNDNNINGSVEGQVFLGLQNKMMEAQLREFNYMADMAKLQCSTNQEMNAVLFTFHGFDSSLKVYVVQFLKNLKAYNPTLENKEARQLFELVKQKYVQELKNKPLSDPYMQAYHQIYTVMGQQKFEDFQKLEALLQFTYEEYLKMNSQWLKSGNLVWLFAGNLNNTEAEQIQTACEDILEISSKVKRSEVKSKNNLKLPSQGYLIYEKELENKDNQNSVIASYFQSHSAPPTLREEYIMTLLFQLMKEPCFSKLRTEEQLGYIVFSFMRNEGCVPFGCFLIQSAVGSPEFLASRIDAFISEFRNQLQQTTPAQLQQQKESLMTQIKEKDRSIKQEFQRFWDEIKTHQYLFDRREQSLELLGKEELITLPDILDCFDQLFSPASQRRMDVMLMSAQHKENQEEWRAKRTETSQLKRVYMGGDHEKENKFSQFKAQHAVYPDFELDKWAKFFQTSKL